MKVSAGRIQDIANVLNLSKGTVSRALNGRGDIAQQTRSRVLEVAETLKYKPRRRRDAAQRGAVGRKLGRVCLVLGDRCANADGTLDPSYVGFHVLTHVERAANEVGVGLMVSFVSATDPNLQLDQLRVLRSHENDAAILVYPFPEPLVERLASVMPIVSLEVIYPNANVDVIGPSHALDAMRAVEHLYRLGHRRIAYVGDEGSTGHRLTQGLRHAGYVSGLARCGLTYRTSDVFNVGEGRIVQKPELSSAIASLVAEGITGVITSIDRHGYLLWQDLPARHGLRVPGDVSLVGIGGIPRAEGQPQLTTFRCDYDAIATAALELARSRHAGRSGSGLYQEFPSTFVPGGSAAAPAIR